MSNSPLSDDPEFQAAATALGRLLNGPTMEETVAQLSQTMQAVARMDSPLRPFIVGQINMLSIVTGWVSLVEANPDATIRAEDAIQAILTAIEDGLGGERYV
jgi:hypothetical protein